MIYVSVTQAQAAVMAATAAKFDSASSGLDDMLRRLMDELSVLSTRWQGAGGRSFEQVRQRWMADQIALNRSLRDTAEAIRAAGRRYGTSDTAVAERIDGTRRGGMSLPL